MRLVIFWHQATGKKKQILNSPPPSLKAAKFHCNIVTTTTLEDDPRLYVLGRSKIALSPYNYYPADVKLGRLCRDHVLFFITASCPAIRIWCCVSPESKIRLRQNHHQYLSTAWIRLTLSLSLSLSLSLTHTHTHTHTHIPLIPIGNLSW